MLCQELEELVKGTLLTMSSRWTGYVRYLRLDRGTRSQRRAAAGKPVVEATVNDFSRVAIANVFHQILRGIFCIRRWADMSHLSGVSQVCRTD
jgi:hypothetical protein